MTPQAMRKLLLDLARQRERTAAKTRSMVRREAAKEAAKVYRRAADMVLEILE